MSRDDVTMTLGTGSLRGQKSNAIVGWPDTGRRNGIRPRNRRVNFGRVVVRQLTTQRPMPLSGRGVAGAAFGGITVKSKLLGAAFAAAVVLGAVEAHATVYNIEDAVGSNTVAGTITTDGTLGTLSAANIVDWHLAISDGGSFNVLLVGPLSGPSSGVQLIGTALSATATSLSFNFSANPLVPVSEAGRFLLEFYLLGGGDVIWISSFTFQGDPNHTEVPGLLGIEFFNANGNCTDCAYDNRSGVQTVTSATPLPAALPLFATGLGALGLLARRRKRKNTTTV
jgi:hypothetical protein